MMKHGSLAMVAGVLFGVVSCSPVGEFSSAQQSAGQAQTSSLPGSPTFRATPQGSLGGNERVTSGDLRNLREQREAAGSEHLIHNGRGHGGEIPREQRTGSGDPNYDEDGVLATLPPLDIDYRYAVPVPGRKGWVYNPFTNRPVDVRGVDSGRLIYDERDPANRDENGNLRPVAEMPNKFRVP